MKKQVGTVDVTPSPTAYANILIAIIENDRHPEKEWARLEIRKAFRAAATLNPDKWGKES